MKTLTACVLFTASLLQALPPENSTFVEISNGEQITNLKQKLYAIQAGQRKHLTVLRIGDSMTSRLSLYIERDVLAPWFQSPPITTEVIGQGSPNKGRGGIIISILPRDQRITKSDYGLSFVGSHALLPVGGQLEFAKNLSRFKLSGDRISIPYVKSPDSGQFSIELDGVTIEQENVLRGPELIGGEFNVDAYSEEREIDWLTFKLSGNPQFVVSITHLAGGEIRFLHPMMGVEDSEAVNFYHLGEGSNSFTNADPQSVPIMAGLIEMLEPDIITTHSDDNLEGYENFLPLLHTAIQQANLESEPLVVLIGAGPKINFTYNSDYTDSIIEANAYQRQFAIDNGLTFLDLMGVAVDMDTLIAREMAGDGVHLSPVFHRLGAHVYGNKTGLFNTNIEFPSDLDGDGLDNLKEVSDFGSHPLLADTDGDGLTDNIELQLGLSPRVSITSTLQTLEATAPALMLDSPLISTENGKLSIGFHLWTSENLKDWSIISPESAQINDTTVEVDLGPVPDGQGFYKIQAK